MDGIKNFRELGGLPTGDGREVRRGVLFRSAHLAAATDDDLARIEAFSVRTVFDLRTEHDMDVDGGTRTPAGADYVHQPVGDLGSDGAEGSLAAGFREVLFSGTAAEVAEKFGDGRAEEMIVNGQRMFVEHPSGIAAARRYLELAGEPSAHALLLHCSAGKDRTGWLCSTLLYALGVIPEAIEAHYLESDAGGLARQRLETLVGDRGIDPEVLLPFLEVRADYLHASMRAAADVHGSMEGYLAFLGVHDEQRRRLQDLLLVG